MKRTKPECQAGSREGSEEVAIDMVPVHAPAATAADNYVSLVCKCCWPPCCCCAVVLVGLAHTAMWIGKGQRPTQILCYSAAAAGLALPPTLPPRAHAFHAAVVYPPPQPHLPVAASCVLSLKCFAAC